MDHFKKQHQLFHETHIAGTERRAGRDGLPGVFGGGGSFFSLLLVTRLLRED